MTDRRSGAPRGTDPHAAKIADDLRALRSETTRDAQGLARHVATLRSRRPDMGLTWRISTMASTRARGPLLASAVALALLLAALIVPISYPRTTGHQVALSLTGADPAQVRAIAGQLKSALAADQVKVQAEQDGATTQFTFEANVPMRGGIDPALVASAFAARLSAMGYHASATTTPIIERVSGTVYAYASDLVIRINTEGKSAAQLENEIKQRFAEAGIPDAKVSVTDQGNEHKVTVEVQRSASGPDAQKPGNIKLELTKDGKPLDAKGLSVQERMLRSDKGSELQLDIADNGRTASVVVKDPKTKSDAAIAAEVETQLRAAGLDLKVTVKDGRVSVENR